jgi:regulatory protein
MVHSGTLKRLGIRVGAVLDVSALKASEAAEAREFALRSLASRGRTAAELAGILRRKGFTAEEAEETLNWVRQQGLIDEEQLLEDTVESLLRRKGTHQIRRILAERGFSASAADRAIKAHGSDPEHFRRVVAQSRKKMAELQQRYPEQWGQRLGAWLYGRGHDSDLIRKVLAELKSSEDSSIEEW